MRILSKMSCFDSDNRLIFPNNASPHNWNKSGRTLQTAFSSARHHINMYSNEKKEHDKV